MNRTAPIDAAFRWVAIAGAIFVLLTVAAMLIDPGGRVGDDAAIATIVTQSLLVLRAPSLRERPLRAGTGPAR